MGLIRLFFALVVATDHWRTFVLKPRSINVDELDYFKSGFNAGYAVMFFYVTSGFLITYTLIRNHNRDVAGDVAFYRNRFIRIFSLYWPMVLVAFLLLPGAWQQFLAKNVWDQITSLTLFGMDVRLAFASYPETHVPATIYGLFQAWTLGAEAIFYLAAPLLLRSWKTAVAVLCASFGLRAVMVILIGPDLHAVWTYQFIGTTFGFFLLGHLICLAAQRWRIIANPLLGVALVGCSFAAMEFVGSYAVFDGRRFWLSVLLFTLALPGLFEATKGIRWMNIAGDLSYPVYLVHTLVLMLLGLWIVDFALPLETLPATDAAYVSIGAYLVVTIVLSALVHKLVEVPVARAMHWLIPRWRRPALQGI
jgi:peptidoglycan/LPS O-acetylase OafA/YrhL